MEKKDSTELWEQSEALYIQLAAEALPSTWLNFAHVLTENQMAALQSKKQMLDVEKPMKH